MNEGKREAPFLKRDPAPGSMRQPSMTRRRFLKFFGTAAVAGGAGLYWHAFYHSPYNPVVTRRTFAFPGLPDAFRGLRIAHLTDLHHSELVPYAYLEACIERVNALDPDVVFLTGDYVSHSQDLTRSETRRRYVEPLGELFGGIRARLGVYAVLGNHDVAVAFRQMSDVIRGSGAVLLQDARVRLEIDGRRLSVVGLRDYGTQIVQLQEAWGDLPNDEPALVLMHNPDLFPDMDPGRNALIFSGHTHGGQVRLPFYGAVARYIPSEYGNRFAEGFFRNGNLVMYVNRGLGMIRIPVRFNCPPEIALMTLE